MQLKFCSNLKQSNKNSDRSHILLMKILVKLRGTECCELLSMSAFVDLEKDYNSSFFKRKNKATVIFKTGRFDNTDSEVIISRISRWFCTTLHTLLMMTAEFVLSKRPVLRITVALFFFVCCFCLIFIVFMFLYFTNLSTTY